METAPQTSVTALLEPAFNAGYNNAKEALTKMLNRNISLRFLMHGVSTGKRKRLNLKAGIKRSHHTITTEIFGDVAGKSYLIISDADFMNLTETLPVRKNGVDLRQEFIKEVDNILSASVISKLSNLLKVTMYGDVPNHLGSADVAVEDLVANDFRESEEVYTNSISLDIDGSDMTLLFVWVIDVRSLRVHNKLKAIPS